MGFEGRTAQFFRDLPVEKRSAYKYQHDYRIKTKSGNYIRLLHQILPLEYDQENIYRSLVLHTDISHIKPDGCPTLSIIGLDGEPSYYNIQDVLIVFNTNDMFTKRERQILNYIVEGKTSKEIAGELLISLHTVNAHRKNILSKAGAKTPFELVNKVLVEGWI